ncbi:unnamed protein product [Closterium sp. NIES-65]|nr:unnamed protein product [Closterium sp. NIES-65]
MYAVTGSDEDDCYRCFPARPGIGTAASCTSEAAALGASASVLSGAGESALSGTSAGCGVLADPSGGPVLSRFSTVLPCPAAPSGTLTGLYLPSFSTNLVSGADLQDAGVHQFTPARQRVTHCTEADTGRHLATCLLQRPGLVLSLPLARVVVCLTRPSSGTTAWPTPLCFGSEAWPRESLCLVFPRSLPPLPPGLALPVSPVSRGASVLPLTPPSFLRQRPRCRRFTWTCGAQPASVDRVRSATSLLVVDDYSRYTTVFPLRSKGEVTAVLIDWIREARLQLRRSFGSDFPVLRLHSDRGGEFSSGLLSAYCRARGIRQTFTLPDSPQQNGIAERRIGMVMDVARTSMMHAAAPHFLWPFAVRYAAHQINHPPQGLSTGDLPSPAVDGEGWRCCRVPGLGISGFYHPTSRRVLSSQDVTFDESVPYYRLFPTALRPSPHPRSSWYQTRSEPFEVTGDSGAAAGAEPGGTASGGAEPGGAEPGVLSLGVLSLGVLSLGVLSLGVLSLGVLCLGVLSLGVLRLGVLSLEVPSLGVLCLGVLSLGVLCLGVLRLAGSHSPRRSCVSGLPGAGGSAAGAGGSSAAEGTAASRPAGARTVGAGAAGSESSPGAGATEGVGAEPAVGGPTDSAPGAAAGGSGSFWWCCWRCCWSGLLLPGLLPQLQPASPLPAPSPDPGPTGGLTERREPASRPGRLRTRLRAASPTVTRLLATAVTDPSFESSAASALVTELVDFAARCRLDYAARLVTESESACPPSVGDIPTPRSYAEAIEGPYSSQWQAAMDAEMASWKSTGTYVDALPPPGANIVSGMWIFRPSPPTPKMTTLRVLLHVAAHRDYELHSLDFSTAFLQGSLHEEIWLRRPPGFTGSFPPGTQWSLRRPVYGLRQAPREWHDTLRTTLAALGFAPSTADPSLFLRTDTSLPPFYILVYVDDLVFATADTAGLAYVKARRTITLTQSHMVQQVLQRFGFTYSSPQATPLPTRHSLSALPSDESVESSGPYAELVGCLMYLMTCTRPDLAYPLSILARYVAPGRHRPEHMAAAKRVLRYLCSTSGMGLVLGGRSPVVLTGHADASWADDQATQRSSQGYTFSLGSGSVSWRATRSSSVLGSSCEAEIYAGAMAAEELRWLTYLLTDLGEQPRSPPVLYVDNKAMLALCREQRLEHRTKHIALRYFLARELQQRGQLRLAYVASEANTADVFTKALAPCDHQRCCTQLGLVPVLPHLLSS